jgi:hypothetical protein
MENLIGRQTHGSHMRGWNNIKISGKIPSEVLHCTEVAQARI